MGRKVLKHHLDIRGKLKRFSGAVRSGNNAARLSLFFMALSPFTRLFDKLICQAIDNNKINGALPPCLMIVSPPRSGSTIAYQVLTRVIPCVYISNFHFLFPNYASFYLSRKNLFGINLSEFNNFYGYTSCIHDVNEGNEIIEKIFRRESNVKWIRKKFIKFLEVMRATCGHPLIFKNVRAYVHLALLHQAVPEIVFLRIRRNLEQIVQSVLKAYYELGTFHPIPEVLANRKINDAIEFAVYQIIEIERIIDIQKNRINQSTWLEWSYEELCSDPWPMIENIAENYLEVDLFQLRRNAVSDLKVSKRIKVSADEAKRISFLLRTHMDRSC